MVARLTSLEPRLIVRDWGYERVVVAALAAAGLPVVVANPRQVRDEVLVPLFLYGPHG